MWEDNIQVMVRIKGGLADILISISTFAELHKDCFTLAQLSEVLLYNFNKML